MDSDKKKLYNWDNISGDRYFAIMDVINDESLADIDKEVAIAAIVEDVDPDVIYSLPMAEAKKRLSMLAFLSEFDMKTYKSTLKSIRVNGKTYRILADVSEMTMAQYIDYETFSKMPFRDGYDKMLSVFIIPDGAAGYNDGYDVAEVQRMIREDISFREVQGLLNFFVKGYMRSVKRSLAYIRRQIRLTRDRQKKATMTAQYNQIVENIQKMLTALETLRGLTNSTPGFAISR